MTELADKIIISELYNIYGELLTNKQQDLFELYYFEDYSIIEIASMHEVTKNAIYNSLKKSIKQLQKYEEILQVKANYEANIDLLLDNNIDSKIIEAVKR